MRTLMLALSPVACAPSLVSHAPAQAPKIAAIATVDCAQLPVGPPNGQGYRVAQGFGKNRHLGEDWNGVGGGNTDLGDPVYAMADGQISVARDVEGGWGRIVRIVHHFDTATGDQSFESLYAHLDRFNVAAAQPVDRGQQIGTIGDAHGVYVAHLHLEVRDQIGLPLGPGYASNTTGYVDPRTWVEAHQTGCPKD